MNKYQLRLKQIRTEARNLDNSAYQLLDRFKYRLMEVDRENPYLWKVQGHHIFWVEVTTFQWWLNGRKDKPNPHKTGQASDLVNLLQQLNLYSHKHFPQRLAPECVRAKRSYLEKCLGLEP